MAYTFIFQQKIGYAYSLLAIIKYNPEPQLFRIIYCWKANFLSLIQISTVGRLLNYVSNLSVYTTLPLFLGGGGSKNLTADILVQFFSVLKQINNE